MNFLNASRNVYSQNGEDGIIEQIFSIIGFESELCCEFGAWDGIHFSNTRNLIERQDITAFMLEGDKHRFRRLQTTYTGNPKVICINTYIDTGANKLGSVLRNKGVPDDRLNRMDLLSIDIDGLDYAILESLDISPRLIVIEVNAGHDPESLNRIPANVAKNNVGQPLAVFTAIAKQKGYVLICYNGNAFYLQQSIAEQHQLRGLTDAEAYHDFLITRTEAEKRWLYLVNKGRVTPFYKFQNPKLEAENLKLHQPVLTPFKERVKGLVAKFSA